VNLKEPRRIEKRRHWLCVCRCSVFFALFSLNLQPVDAETLPAVDGRATEQTQQEPSSIQQAVAVEPSPVALLRLSGEQLRSFKFFLAGCILSLLIVLICSLFRNTAAAKIPPPTANTQHYPPHYFAPPPGVPPHTLSGSEQPHSAPPPVQSMPYGMYYPSIPLSLSMPVAWPSSSHPAAHPGQPPETQSNQNPATHSTQSLNAHDVQNPPLQSNQVPLTSTQPSINSGTQGDTTGLPLASVQGCSHGSTHNDDAGQQDSTMPHSVLDMSALKGDNEAHRAKRRNSTEAKRSTAPGAAHSPLLDEIINHTRHLKTLV